MDERQIKKAVRRRDGFRCTDCDISQEAYFAAEGRRLDVHRLVPGSAYTVDGCVSLCRKCHKAAHKKLRQQVPRELLLAYQAAVMSETSYRRGYEQGFAAAQGKCGAKAPNAEAVHRWRYARNRFDVSQMPPGTRYDGGKASIVMMAAMQSSGWNELDELLQKLHQVPGKLTHYAAACFGVS